MMQLSGDEVSSSEASESWEKVNFNSTKSKQVEETLKKLEAVLSPTDDSDSSEGEERCSSGLSDFSLGSPENTFQPDGCSILNGINHPVSSVVPDFQSDTNANSNMVPDMESSEADISSPEERADDGSEHIGNDHNVVGLPRMNNLLYSYVDSKANLYCEDLTSDDEVWLIDYPTSMKVESLVGQPVVFGGTSKVPVFDQDGNRTTFEVVTSSKMRKNVNCILPSRTRKGYEAVNLDVMGHLTIREKLKTLRVEIPPGRLATVPFPMDLKVRHPLFGPDYKNEINVAPVTPKRKKGGSSSRRRVKLETDPPPENAEMVSPRQEEPIPPVKLKLKKVKDLLADRNEDQHKKAHKRGHSSESEPEVKKKKKKHKHDPVVWERSSSESEPPVKKKKKRSEGIWAPFSSSCLKSPPNLSQSLPVQDPEGWSPCLETRSDEKPRRKHKEGKRVKLEKE